MDQYLHCKNEMRLIWSHNYKTLFLKLHMEHTHTYAFTSCGYNDSFSSVEDDLGVPACRGMNIEELLTGVYTTCMCMYTHCVK